MTWLQYLGLTDKEAARILAVSRKACDDAEVRRAVIDRVVKGVAIVKRWSVGDEPMPDYPVRVSSNKGD